MDISSLLNVWNSSYYGSTGLTGVTGITGTIPGFGALSATNQISGSSFLEMLVAEMAKAENGETDGSAISEAFQKYLDKRYGSTKSANSKGYAASSQNRISKGSLNINKTTVKTDTVQGTERNFRQAVAKSEKMQQEMFESYKKNVLEKADVMQRGILL